MKWEDYMNSWKPNWQLRNTQILYATIQPHGDLQHLVSERNIYPKYSKWIHDMVFDHSRHMENLEEYSLNLHFRDLNIIWREENNRFNIYHKYIVINRTRYPRFKSKTLVATT